MDFINSLHIELFQRNLIVYCTCLYLFMYFLNIDTLHLVEINLKENPNLHVLHSYYHDDAGCQGSLFTNMD